MNASPPLTLGDLFPEWRRSPRAVSGLAADSRKVRPGEVFVAVPGTQSDCTAFIPHALQSGAVAVVGEGERRVVVAAVVD